MNGVSEVRKSSKIRPLVLKAASEATDEMGMACTSRAKCAKMGNRAAFTFHHLAQSGSECVQRTSCA